MAEWLLWTGSCRVLEPSSPQQKRGNFLKTNCSGIPKNRSDWNTRCTMLRVVRRFDFSFVVPHEHLRPCPMSFRSLQLLPAAVHHYRHQPCQCARTISLFSMVCTCWRVPKKTVFVLLRRSPVSFGAFFPCGASAWCAGEGVMDFAVLYLALSLQGRACNCTYPRVR